MSDSTGFVWGVATSAHQIEGGRHEDGKLDSIWDRFHDVGRMPNSGAIACDHYHRWREDVALMAELGVSAYRFSVAWTRIVPDGSGAANERGIAFYDRLVDALLEAGITPWITLYHWDLPQALETTGGWINRATVDAFASYADVLTRRLGDRVTHWITHNEPWVAAHLGYIEGQFAPGRTSWPEGLVAGHHILLSHGRAVPVIRANVPDASVGIAIDCRPSKPASHNPADVAANRHFDGYRNRWFFDPVFGRGYPQDMLAAYAGRGRITDQVRAAIQPGDMDAVAVPIDFLGLNYYTSLAIEAGSEESEATGVEAGPNPPDGYTEMGWPITAAALTRYLIHLNETYEPASIVITENGASYSDGPDGHGAVHDDRRIDYLDRHLRACVDALRAGVPLDGYFAWSLMDNLEWVHGYGQRFGLIHVDHQTQVRTPKKSYYWYQDRIRRSL